MAGAQIPHPPRGVQPVLWHLIYAYSHQLHLDPYAVAAVSIAEGGGRFGAVGDGGTSYGPFQLHRGGALPSDEGARWANSPAGVRYAMTRMAVSGAAGLHGLAAIRAIVTRFERPANPHPEVSRSWQTVQGWSGDPGFGVRQGGNVDPGFNVRMNGNVDPGFLVKLQRRQSQSLAQALARQQNVFKGQLAAQNQSRLVQSLQQQAQAHIDGARTAQQSLSAGGYAAGSGQDSQTTLGALSRQRLDDLRLAALRRAGIT